VNNRDVSIKEYCFTIIAVNNEEERGNEESEKNGYTRSERPKIPILDIHDCEFQITKYHKLLSNLKNNLK